jgi:hypothetical protein
MSCIAQKLQLEEKMTLKNYWADTDIVIADYFHARKVRMQIMMHAFTYRFSSFF